jgi:hypothetical protein
MPHNPMDLDGLLTGIALTFCLYTCLKITYLAAMLQFDSFMCGRAEISLSSLVGRSTRLSECEKAFYCILNLHNRMALNNNLSDKSSI